ncbi:hypothetical protein GH714_024359 [Hevea brasiliensis]|uniref:Transposase MuDR plant domain-containing protein n=1 Tax=Hevea brasiliensis TaxID=3981 RepID=A0A6A6LB05_HEVBR|nr:hypothetical protein GH714_024359 [Hevea brasiliensis]
MELKFGLRYLGYLGQKSYEEVLNDANVANMLDYNKGKGDIEVYLVEVVVPIALFDAFDVINLDANKRDMGASVVDSNSNAFAKGKDATNVERVEINGREGENVFDDGLVETFNELMLGVEHRHCVKHLCENYKKLFRGLEYKKMWYAAGAGTEKSFNSALSAIKDFDVNAHDWPLNKDARVKGNISKLQAHSQLQDLRHLKTFQEKEPKGT